MEHLKFFNHVDISGKLQVPTVALLMHQNSWYDMFAVVPQMALDTGWVHLVKELFPLSNISGYHTFMSCERKSTEVGVSAEYVGMSEWLAWVRKNHITEIQTRYTIKHNTLMLYNNVLCYAFPFIRTINRHLYYKS